jgi:hypothetical protein
VNRCENRISAVLVQRSSTLMEMIGKAVYKIKKDLKRDYLYKDTIGMFFLGCIHQALTYGIKKEVHQ